VIANITTAVLCTGIGVWALWLVIRAQRKEHAERRSARLYKRVADQRGADLANVGSGVCASCNGEVTALRRENGQLICADRELCRQTMIFHSMLDSMA
jgi:ABC-type nickel/cobalt efflux system permease component RcnA